MIDRALDPARGAVAPYGVRRVEVRRRRERPHRHLIAALAAHDVRRGAAMIMGAHSNKAKLLLKERVGQRRRASPAASPRARAAVAAYEPEAP
jgi:hypothetical protein